MNTRLALAITAVTMSCSALAAGAPAAATAWSGRQYAKEQARQLTKARAYAEYRSVGQNAGVAPHLQGAAKLQREFPASPHQAQAIGDNHGWPGASETVRKDSMQRLPASPHQQEALMSRGHDPIGLPASLHQAQALNAIAPGEAGASETVRKESMERKLPATPAQREELAAGTGAKVMLSNHIR